ncbi:uncharacterized protein LOC108323135 [Vigna angularis]|uniref:uncharacterized protein LOC108323135 n=1 Tax=Phaseolus angularis TaxID=3914 RepID=UPI000809D250|nr:uncharacterized protein LOC108323135 [Vigna angularis]
MIDFKWEVGTYFVDKQDILDAIKSYVIENGKILKLVENDKKRIRVKCLGSKGECPWRAYFGFMDVVKSWKLRTVVDRHTCSREHKLRLFNAKWCNRKLEKTLRENPNVKGVDIRDKITRKWNIAISKNMAYGAKAYASDEVAGSFRRNPGSTIKVKVESYDGKSIFKRFYACLKACKDSFVSCRPIIGLDGAFLKGRHRGELLTVVARDANDQMLPLAYAIIEVENKETWTWFMELLIEYLGGPEVCSSLTIISDQQKGLLQAVQDVILGVVKILCKAFICQLQEEIPWKEPEKAYVEGSYSNPPTKMGERDEMFWSRSRFTTATQCDTLTNNMLEAFNSVLVNTRTKPIFTMLEEIRLYMMKRWATNRSRAMSFKSSICPKILSRLQKEGLQTMNWIPSWSAQRLFEVRHVSQSGEKFVVDIDQYSCSCRKWSISGIPCVHALAAMRFLSIHPEDYIPVCYQKSTYEEIYSSIIYPINGNNLWKVTQSSNVMPPSTRQMSGRPKKKRRLEQWKLKKSSTKMSKGGLLKRCGICREVGHNRKNYRRETRCRKRDNNLVHYRRVKQMEKNHFRVEDYSLF